MEALPVLPERDVKHPKSRSDLDNCSGIMGYLRLFAAMYGFFVVVI